MAWLSPPSEAGLGRLRGGAACSVRRPCWRPALSQPAWLQVAVSLPYVSSPAHLARFYSRPGLGRRRFVLAVVALVHGTALMISGLASQAAGRARLSLPQRALEQSAALRWSPRSSARTNLVVLVEPAWRLRRIRPGPYPYRDPHDRRRRFAAQPSRFRTPCTSRHIRTISQCSLRKAGARGDHAPPPWPGAASIGRRQSPALAHILASIDGR